MVLTQNLATTWQPNGNTGKVSKGKYSIGEYSVVEVSENGNQENDTDSNEKTENVDNSVDNSKLEYLGGTLGKGVVLLTEEQMDSLYEKLGFDGANHYIERLATWIIDKNAKVGNHYELIMKFAEEDKKV